MNPLIQSFLATKSLSANSLKAYQYDLQGFLALTGGVVNAERLKLYEQSLVSLKPSARKRQLSTVNQFLYYLYRQGLTDAYFRLENAEKPVQIALEKERLDRSAFYAYDVLTPGQVIAVLILDLGLLPSEIIGLRWEQIDLDFQVLTLKNDALVRVVKLTPVLVDMLSQLEQSETYLFERAGQAYSRQWLNKSLAAFLKELGQPDLTPQKLRQDFILKAVEEGVSQADLARQLGLKTGLTLEKFYKHNGY
ncbi:site-specific tyrosine recombinase XerD [Streptococcus caprae]|uniref:Site-specific tyrosine recombinase XerD n=1 Tax=Streptococcus caprae TaxID=1640501 RepID=A0ABV8CX71_9STRE